VVNGAADGVVSNADLVVQLVGTVGGLTAASFVA